MSRCVFYLCDMLLEPTLADLAAASGLQARTIRSWVAQGILPGPLSRGPAARYPADTPQRLLAIRTMRDLLGMSLTAIRQELLVASPEQVEAWAAKAAALAPEPPEPAAMGMLLGAEPPPPPPTASRPTPATPAALDYLRGLRSRAAAPAASASMLAQGAQQSLRLPPTGFGALEERLEKARAKPSARKARAEEWLRIPITPDVELSVRGRLDAEQRAQLERCADLVRDILLGRDR
jgi:DNA-binding transcriptional MerR regulator